MIVWLKIKERVSIWHLLLNHKKPQTVEMLVERRPIIQNLNIYCTYSEFSLSFSIYHLVSRFFTWSSCMLKYDRGRVQTGTSTKNVAVFQLISIAPKSSGMAVYYSDISILQCNSNPVDKWYHHYRTHCLQSCSLVSPSWLIYVFIQVKDSHTSIASVPWAGNRYRLNETVFHHPCVFFPIAHELILKCVHGKIRTVVLRLKSLFDDSLQRSMSLTILYP